MSPNRSGQHQRQELEANVFAIEVLTPRPALHRYLAPPAGLRQALAIADAFDISREAAVRRYVALQTRPVAAVFSRNHRVRYVVKGEGFPSMKVWAGHCLRGMLSPEHTPGNVTPFAPADPTFWLGSSCVAGLSAQTLYQANGHAVTLLVAERHR